MAINNTERWRYLSYQAGLYCTQRYAKRCQLCHVAMRPQPNPSSIKSVSANPTITSGGTIPRSLLCVTCHASLSLLPEPLTLSCQPPAPATLPVQPACVYQYPVSQAIIAFKHRKDMQQLPFLWHLLRQLPRPKGYYANNSVLVPMPTTNARLRRRGFDPVTLLVALLSRHWHIPVWRGVQRIDQGRSQQGLSRAERLRNLAQAFTCIQPCPRRRAILFDDVVTTGASLTALAQTLAPAMPTSAATTASSPVNTSSVGPFLCAVSVAHGEQR